jgi:hypothetical protein
VPARGRDREEDGERHGGDGVCCRRI